MLIYLLVLILVISWVYLEERALARKSFWFPLIVLSLFAGIRSYNVGTDSIEYVRDFISPVDIDSFSFNDDVELGYQLLSYAVLKTTTNYFWLFFITALIIVGCHLSIIKKYSVNYCLSIFFFFTLGSYIFFFNGLRQGLAMALFVLAVPYLLKNKIIPYLLICVFASLFHISALFMIPFYFIVSLKIKSIYKILITFLGSLFISRFLVFYIATTNERYEGYTEASEAAGGFLILSFYVLLMFSMYLVSHIYKIREDMFTKLFTFYASGIVFIIPLAMLGTNPSGPQRLLSYFTWTLVLLLPMILKKINNIYIYVISITISIAYFVLTTSRFSNLTPYIINPIFEVF